MEFELLANNNVYVLYILYVPLSDSICISILRYICMHGPILAQIIVSVCPLRKNMIKMPNGGFLCRLYGLLS